LDVSFGDFNVLIGPNASGKSNLVQVFKFLRDIGEYGLDNAISMQGGAEYLRNAGTKSNIKLSLDVEGKPHNGNNIRHLPFLNPIKISYRFNLNFEDNKVSIDYDELIVDFSIRKRRTKKTKSESPDKGRIVMSNVKGKLSVKVEPDDERIKEIKSFLKYVIKNESKEMSNKLMLEVNVIFRILAGNFLRGIALYDFDPKLPKRSVAFGGKVQLEENSTNLSIVLKRIIENDKEKRKLSNLVRDILPFVSDLGINKLADKSLLFNLKENYYKDSLPSSLLSDGTVNIMSLIVAIFFENNEMVIIEEPEKNIHPYLISKIMDMAKEASSKKQIILTTHSPQIVQNAGLENLLLVSRDENGFSSVTRPFKKKEVKDFLKNELGVEDLFINNYL